MASETPGRRYRACYAMLLRLHTRAFREQFGEGMRQTFDDLCRKRRSAHRALFGLALWVFCETSAGIVKENIMHMTQLSRTMLRVALGALGLLMVPLVASRVVPGWNWPVRAFVLVYVLFFALGMAYALIARRMGSWAYKAGVGVALAAGFVLAWSNMVHIADAEGPVFFVYYAVLAVGIAGAWMAHLKARGLAYTLFAMAATMAVIAVVLPPHTSPELVRSITVGHVGLVVLFAVAGLLFRQAGLAEVRRS